MSDNQTNIVVTGAAGHFGRRVLTHLLETYGYPASQVIATSRTPESLGEWAQMGIELRKADFNEPASLTEAFRGAEKLLLISTDSADNDTRLKQHLEAIEAAKAAGVGHIFYTSMPEAQNSLVSFASVHFGTEEALKESGLEWTILRNAWYFENLLNSIPGALASGTLYSAAGDGRISYISRDDLARAAAAALDAPSGMDRITFTVTGAEALDIETVAAKVAKATERPLNVVHVPVETIVEGLRSHGLPEPVAVMLASFDVAAKAGNMEIVTSDYEKLTSQHPQPFDDWLAENKGAFAP